MKKERINNLQILRAVAALMVVYAHTEFAFWKFGGFGGFGVPVFFVISGFIMADVCAVDSSEFFKRRLIRIVPFYWLMTLMMFAVALKYPQLVVATRASLSELFKSLFFIPFMKSNGAIIPMLFVGWTLNFEMLFYTIVSISLSVSRRFAMTLTVLTVLILQIILFYFIGSNSILKFYAGPLMFDFISGIAVYHLYVKIAKPYCVQIRGLSIAVALISFLSMVMLEGWYRISVHDYRYGLPSFLLVLSLIIISKAGFDSRSMTLVLIGDSSYVLYLSHPFVVDFIRRVLTHSGFEMLRNDRVPGMLLSIVTSTLVAIGIHLWMERPLIRYLNTKFLRDRRTGSKFDHLVSVASPVGNLP